MFIDRNWVTNGRRLPETNVRLCTLKIGSNLPSRTRTSETLRNCVAGDKIGLGRNRCFRGI